MVQTQPEEVEQLSNKSGPLAFGVLATATANGASVAVQGKPYYKVYL
jgi:hypothetical protein